MTETIPAEVILAMSRDCLDSEHTGGEQMVRAALRAAEFLGWVMVPTEATATMECAVDPSTCEGGNDHWPAPEYPWQRMIAARPKVP